MTITEIPPGRAGEVTLEIKVKVDDNGILQCEANAIVGGVSTKVKAEIDYEIKFNFDVVEETN